MSENHDVLQRAARALRETHTGDSERSPFTRARVMRSLHEDKKRRLSRTLVFWPFAAVLIGSTAWAAATGQLPEIWQRAEEWLTNVQAPTAPVSAIPQPGRPSSAHGGASQGSEPVATPSEVAPVETALTAEPEPSVAPSAVPTELPAPEAPRVVARRAHVEPPPHAEPPPTQPEEDALPPELAKDPEFAEFRRAHELHFQGSRSREAIEQYRAYLAKYPGGRFVPEARYNIALNLLKLGRRSEARELLQAFADGRYGNYRKAQAAELIGAIDGASREQAPDGSD